MAQRRLQDFQVIKTRVATYGVLMPWIKFFQGFRTWARLVHARQGLVLGARFLFSKLQLLLDIKANKW